MTILAECPICHRKQANKNRTCGGCDEDLNKAKGSKRVRYWIDYRVNGRHKREPVGFKLKDAQDAESKRRVQKRENKFFEILKDSKITFEDLTKWYLNLKSVQRLNSYSRLEGAFKNFNNQFGKVPVNKIRLEHLENYQILREEQGRAPATIDMELRLVKTMVTKAIDNDKVDGNAIKPFRGLKKKLKSSSNARTRTLSIEEYKKLLDCSPLHLKNILIVAFNTGMRLGEIRNLRWENIDLDNNFIRLQQESTKEGKSKNVPLNHYTYRVLEKLEKHPEHSYIFTYLGKAISDRGGIKKSLASACKKAGIPYGRKVSNGFTFHDIRRTVKTNMVVAGVDRVYRDVILGHSLQGMDVHYIALSDENLRQAMDKYTTWLDNHF